MSRLAHTLLLLAIICSANLHLPLLQVAAWAGMLVKYSREASFAEAVVMTFDGEHPCAVCDSIREQETNDSTLKQLTPLHRIVVYFEAPARWIQSLHPLDVLEDRAVPLERVSPLPEVPPPRSFV